MKQRSKGPRLPRDLSPLLNLRAVVYHGKGEAAPPYRYKLEGWISAKTWDLAAVLKHKLQVADDDQLLRMALDALRWKLGLVGLLNEHDGPPPAAQSTTCCDGSPILEIAESESEAKPCF